ncbi:MAG: formylglycine-generating enzyme family protein, partial [Cyanobacteria bacterium J06598_3]
ALYTQALEAEKGYAYPLNEGAVQNLKELQRLLRLRSEDIQRVERQILGGKRSQGEPVRVPPAVSPKISPINNAQRHQVSPVQCPAHPQQGHIQLSVSPAPPQAALAHPPFAPVRFNTVRFNTVRVDARGAVRQTLVSEAITFTECLGDGITLEMVKIPGGRFLIGSPIGEEGASEGEYPQREMSVSDFWMGRTVITRSHWQAFTQHQQPACAEPGSLLAPHRPIENVYWTDAVAFCQWLSQRTGRAYQLPSSAQWEYACRAGTTTPFCFGETITPALANYNGNYAYGQGPRSQYRQETTDVASFPPNAFGLYDMHGNVWEWCLDGWHKFHKTLSADDSARRLSGQKKFLRGGSWSYLPTNCRSAYRLSYPFHNRIDDIGFRVVCLDPTL